MKNKINLIHSRLKNITVAVIGDLIFDKYIWGEANRISPEAPVPIVLAKKESESLGGAGNVIANLAGLNVNTIIIGMVGDDDSGKKMICMLKDLGANTDYLVIKNNDQTTQKTRLVASNQQLVRFDWDNETITDGEKFLLIKNIKSKI